MIVAPIAFTAMAADLSVSFADPAWDGVKVPEDQVCRKLGGKGSTPALSVGDLPAGRSASVAARSHGG